MKTIAATFILLSALSVSAQTNGTLFTCESINNVRHTCKVDAANRMVSVNQQLSDNTCVYGTSWGVNKDRKSVWVDKGCRAEFLVGGSDVARTAFASSVVCESKNNTRTTCPADTSYGVQLSRHMSKNGCDRGHDWGFDQNGIWVDHGCRAEFLLGGDARYVPMVSSSRMTVTCESTNGDRKTCAAPGTYNGVALARQLSKSACLRGQTWGYDGDNIWGSNGCRAEFVVGR